jgi:hypothetical protein
MTGIGERPSKREGNHICPSETGAQRLDELEFERSSCTKIASRRDDVRGGPHQGREGTDVTRLRQVLPLCPLRIPPRSTTGSRERLLTGDSHIDRVKGDKP